MKNHEFTKSEIATYLRDFNNVLIYACFNQNVSFCEIFKYYLMQDGRVQYGIEDYYFEMISIYEMLLVSKILTMFYDSSFGYLNDYHINSFTIPENIFVDKKDKSRFSKKQIIKNIRNAFNHNDNLDHDLVRFLRINENNEEKIKVEIFLKNTKPIPFHIILDIGQLLNITFEIEKANTLILVSYRSTQPILINSFNSFQTLDNIYLRKFYSRKKLTDEQKELLCKHIDDGKKTKNFESFFLANGMEYKDFNFFTDQKLKVKEDLKYWESMGVMGNDVIEHLLNKVMPISIVKDRTLTMNFILSDSYMRNGNNTIFEIVNDSKKVVLNKKCDENSPLWLYVQLFGIDDNILYEAIDFDDLISITNSIYFGYLFDTLVTDDNIIINDTQTIQREKIRDSFVHMRWFKGIKECFKLFDWENGIDNEFNPHSANFFRANIRYVDMLKCSEKYFNSSVKSCYIDLPIHFRKSKSRNGIESITGISFIKNNSYYYIDLSIEEKPCELLICDETQIQRQATQEERDIFINELNNLTKEEKEANFILIQKIKESLISSPAIEKLK